MMTREPPVMSVRYLELCQVLPGENQTAATPKWSPISGRTPEYILPTTLANAALFQQPLHRYGRRGPGVSSRRIVSAVAREIRSIIETLCRGREMSLRHKELIVFAGVVAALLLAGCASPPKRVLSQKSPAYAALPNGYDPLKPGQLSPIYAAVAGGEANPIRQLERKRGHALNILSLSGGGQNGAFGAGLLAGWRESGQRPEFDIVGGVSTGALLATHALLGTPADDAQLEEMYTQITKKDIYRKEGSSASRSALIRCRTPRRCGHSSPNSLPRRP